MFSCYSHALFVLSGKNVGQAVSIPRVSLFLGWMNEDGQVFLVQRVWVDVPTCI